MSTSNETSFIIKLIFYFLYYFSSRFKECLQHFFIHCLLWDSLPCASGPESSVKLNIILLLIDSKRVNTYTLQIRTYVQIFSHVFTCYELECTVVSRWISTHSFLDFVCCQVKQIQVIFHRETFLEAIFETDVTCTNITLIIFLSTSSPKH